MASKKEIEYKSVLDHEYKVENILEILKPDIEFSYQAIESNSTIKAYFNKLSLDNYGLEFNQLIEINNLKLKDENGNLNITFLEIIYNLIILIIKNKWRYGSYISYDMYIMPIRIKKYLRASGYRFMETENIDKKIVFKLVPTNDHAIIATLNNEFYEERINNAILKYRASDEDDFESKLSIFKTLGFFVLDVEKAVVAKFGRDYAHSYYERVNIAMSLRFDRLTNDSREWLADNLDELFDISLVIIVTINDAQKKETFARMLEQEMNREEINQTIELISSAEKKLKELEKSTKYFPYELDQKSPSRKKSTKK